MDAPRRQVKTIQRAVDHWQENGIIGTNVAETLRENIKIIPFDWRLLALFSFIVALICIVISIGTVFSDRELIERLSIIFNSPHYVKLSILTGLSLAIFAFGNYRRITYPTKVYSNEAILFLGVLGIACSVYQLGMMLDTGSGHFSLLLLLTFVIYGILGVLLKSNLIWIFALFSIGGWFGAETGYASGWGAYYLGMSYPLRFVLFGGVLTATAFGLHSVPLFNHVKRSTLVIGLLYLFIALWILSIWGNSEMWYMRNSSDLAFWSLLFAAIAIAAIVHGLFYDDTVTRGFGIVFLFINLYTKFFELFWDGMYKTLFFIVAAIGFWIIGYFAEKWYLDAVSRQITNPK